MALHQSNGIISCTFLKDWLRLEGEKKFPTLLFHLKSLSVCFHVIIEVTSLTITGNKKKSLLSTKENSVILSRRQTRKTLLIMLLLHSLKFQSTVKI